MWAFKRRLAIVSLVFGMILCFGVIPYYIAHIEKPSCFDGKKNQGEEGIDCGGGCALVCEGKAQDLQVKWQKLMQVRPGVYEGAFYIENDNLNVGAKDIPYTMTFKGSDGGVVSERRGTTYVGSNESFLLFEGNVRTGNEKVESVELSIGEFSWVAAPKHQREFTVTEKKLLDVDTFPRLDASVRNDTTVAHRDVEVAAIVSDDTGSVVGYGKTVVDDLAPGESKSVTFSWTFPFSYQASLESCDKPVDVMLVFDRSGSMRSDQKEPPEPLTTAKNAASQFVSNFRPQDQTGLVSFATAPTVPIDKTLTGEKEKVQNAVLGIAIGTDGTQYTNIGDALIQARKELESRRANPSANKAIVLLTDGDPTYPEHPEDKQYPARYAEQAANALKDAGMSLYTIGLGRDVRADYLTGLSGGAERYFAAETAGDLAGVYQKVSSVLCKKAPSVIEVIPRVENALP